MSATDFGALTDAQRGWLGTTAGTTTGGGVTSNTIAGNRAHMVVMDDIQPNKEFRDFVVWLCGFVDREVPPTEKDWAKLQAETKKIAVKMVAKKRQDIDDSWEYKKQGQLFGAVGNSGPVGITTTNHTTGTIFTVPST